MRVSLVPLLALALRPLLAISKFLTKRRKLRFLELSETKLSLKFLTKRRKLRFLELSDTKVSLKLNVRGLCKKGFDMLGSNKSKAIGTIEWTFG